MAAFGQSITYTPILYRTGVVGSGANMVGLAVKWPPVSDYGASICLLADHRDHRGVR